MSIRFEYAQAHAGHSFFKVGLELLLGDLGLLQRFFPTLNTEFSGRSHGDPERVAQIARSYFEDFFRGKISHLSLSGVSMAEVGSFCWFVLDESAARGNTDLSRSTNGGRWVAAGRSFHLGRESEELPHQLPMLVAESHTCFGCGKTFGEDLGFRLSIGPYDLPCCPGRDNGHKKACRLEALSVAKCCPCCGRLSVPLGQVCSSCSKLVNEAEKARKTAGTRVQICMTDGRKLKYDTRKLLVDTLVAVGAEGSERQISVPEAAGPLLERLVEVLNADLEKEYQIGLDRGKNLLFGLAEGSVSVSDFNQGSR